MGLKRVSVNLWEESKMALHEKIIHSSIDRLDLKKVRDTDFSEADLKFMSSLSAAVIQKSTGKSRAIVWVLLLLALSFVLWASLATIDEVTRADGKIIPTQQIQKVQYLEGGTVREILIKEGSIVKKGEVLIKIDSVGFNTQYQENKIRIFELKIKSERLKAQIEGKELSLDGLTVHEFPQLIKEEQSLLASSMAQLNHKIDILKEQSKQKRSDLNEARHKLSELSERYKLIDKEIRLTQPLVKKRLVSEVEFLKLKRQASKLKGEHDSVKLSIARLQSKLQEAKKSIVEAKLGFNNKAKTEYNEVISEIARIEQTKLLLTDKVRRAELRSPVDGTVKQLFVNTIGGVIHPGRDIIEIVPLEDSLVSEVKVRPSDIAYLHVGQEAIVKFSAYDFSIYGGLRGKVEHISADTITDEQGDSFYMIRVQTNKGHLGSKNKPLKIKAGMTVTVDILTGEKTILDYIMKPILKAKNSALRER